MSRLLLFFGVLISMLQSSAQTHDWALQIQGTQNSTLLFTASASSNGNVYIAGRFEDSLFIGSDTHYYFNASNLANALFIACFTEDGQFRWSTSITTALRASVVKLAIKPSGEIVLYGDYSTSTASPSVSFGSYTLNKSRAVYVAFMDSTGAFSGARDLAGSPFFVTAYDMELGPNNAIYAYYYLNGFSGYSIYSNSGNQNGSGYVNVLSKHDSSGQNLIWYKLLDIAKISQFGDITLDDNGDVYYTFSANANVTINGISTGSQRPVFIVKRNGSNGNEIETIKSQNSNNALIHGLETIGESVYFLGSARTDSFNLLGKSVWALDSGSSKVYFYFIGKLNQLDSLEWIQSSTYTNAASSARFSKSGSFLYGSIKKSTSPLSFGGITINSNSLQSALIKSDTMGNLLWAISTPSSIPPLSEPVSSGDIVYYGDFEGTANFDPFTLVNNNNTKVLFLARTFDFSIERGDVFEGPYCAGDSILIPYTKRGAYDTANFFIAQISDENGDFIGGERELGRLKTNQDSVITGSLPFLKVPTSDKYRIRIVSTHPVVQSFYVEDTLQLLIYSTDDADPGRDTFICLGDTIQIQTFGGTQWSWSPNLAIDDSTVRNPLVYPDTSTTYTIRIADSSGCGAPDTADIRVHVLPVPNIDSILISDSTPCINEPVQIVAHFSGGTGQYFSQWMIGDSVLEIHSAGFADTLITSITENSNFILILTDSCSSYIDTLDFSLTLPVTESISSISDSVICFGNTALIEIDLDYVHTDSISIVWEDIKGESIATGALLSFIPDSSMTVYANLTNNCDARQTTDTFSIFVYDALIAEINSNKVNYCRNDSTIIATTVAGGNGNYYYQYIIGADTFISDSLIVISAQSFLGNQTTNTIDSLLVKVEVKDSCSAYSALDSIWLKIEPKLEITKNFTLDSSYCTGSELELSNEVRGGIGLYKHTWFWGDQLQSEDSLFNFISDSYVGQKSSLKYIVSDQCFDTLNIATIIEVKDSLKLELLTAPKIDICYGSNLVIPILKQGGDSSNYQIQWEGINTLGSNSDSIIIEHNFQNISSDSVLILKAILSDNCSDFTSKDSVQITFLPPPVLSFKNDSVTRNQRTNTSVCFGEQLIVTPNVYRAKNYTVEWKETLSANGNSGSLVVDEIQYGKGDTTLQYYFLLYDECSNRIDTATIIISVSKAIELSLPSDTTLCNGKEITISSNVSGGNGAPYKYEWQSNGVISGNNAPQQNSSDTLEETIILTVTDGCSAPSKDTMIIQRLKPINAELLTDSICFATEATVRSSIEGGKPDQYKFYWEVNGVWSQGEDSLNLLMDQEYSLRLAVSDDCSISDTSAILQIAPRPKISNSLPEDSVCEPFVITWNQSSDYPGQYTFTNAINSTLVNTNPSILSQGDYILSQKITNSLGCSDSISSQVIVLAKPEAIISIENNTSNNELFNIGANPTGYNKYNWFIDEEFVNDNSSFSYSFQTQAVYTIKLITEDLNCTDTAYLEYEYSSPFFDYEVSSFSPNNDGLNDFYRPQLTGIQSYRFQVYNRWGQKLFDSEVHGDSWDGTYSEEPMGTGYYLVLIQAEADGITTYLKQIIYLVR